MSTLIMIPTHNEEESIGEVISELLSLDLPILIVASACTDRSPMIAKDFGCIVIESDIGYENACLTGYRWALDNGFDQVVQMDADGQHPSEYVSVILQQSYRGDWIIGSRQGTGTPISMHQRISSWMLRSVVHSLYDMKLHDPTSGMWVLNRTGLECLCTKPSFVSMEAILRVYAKKQGISIVEVPIPMKDRVAGISMHKGYRGLLNWFEASRVLIEYRFFLSNYEKNDYRI